MSFGGYRSAAVICFIASCIHLPAIADECDAILQQGIRNTFQEVRTGDFRTAFKSAYCKKDSSSRGSSSGTEAGGSYGGYGLNFGQNSSDTAQARAENCGDSSSSMSDNNFVKAMQSVADKNIVDAWSSCKSSTYGLVILGELNGSDILVTYRFRSAGSVSQTVVSGTPYISGAKCDDAVKNGTIINTGGRIQSCSRTGDGPVSIAVNTDFQPARFFIPAVVKQQPVQTQPTSSREDRCKQYTGPGGALGCLIGKRFFPGVGVAPEGYTWCVLDTKFNNPPNVQGYCLAKEESGRCSCAKVPAGMPQPSMNYTGNVYDPPPVNP